MTTESRTDRHRAPTVGQRRPDDVVPASRRFGRAVMTRNGSQPQVLGLHGSSGVKQVDFKRNLDAVRPTVHHERLHLGIREVKSWLVPLELRERQEQRFGLVSVAENCPQFRQSPQREEDGSERHRGVALEAAPVEEHT